MSTSQSNAESHTPGPWHVGGDIRVTDDKRIRRNVWGPTPPGMESGEMICQLATVDNARLIAAAPDLLVAAQCEEALGLPQDKGWAVLERHGWDSSQRFELTATEFVKRLRRAAVAKAEGRSDV